MHTLRVLVVDDNHDAAEMLATVVELSGHTPAIASDGAAALQVAERFQPHVVFLDLAMPGMSGYDVARAMRANDRLKHAHLAALTGWPAEDLEEHEHAGFDRFLQKPVEPGVIEEILAEIAQRPLAGGHC